MNPVFRISGGHIEDHFLLNLSEISHLKAEKK